jgi:hypothetical protein
MPPATVPFIPQVAGGGMLPMRLPPPMPPTTTYATAVWTTPPPVAGTDDLQGLAAQLPLPPFFAAAQPIPYRLPTLPLVPVGTPLADAYGFRNPFLD